MSLYKTLIIEDFARLRRSALLILQQRGEFQVIYEASDGLEGVQRAQELQPDLILMDIGLPKLNGIEAARRIRKVSPDSKILFLTQESSAQVMQEAFSLGAQAYVLKSDMDSDLLLAVDAVLQGKQFVSGGLRPSAGNNEINLDPPTGYLRSEQPGRTAQESKNGRVHIIASYQDDASVVDGFTRFIEAALEMENPIILVATEPHRDALMQRLCERGWDMDSAIQRGSYVSLDADVTLSKFMVNDWPDAVRLFGVVDALITKAAKAGKKPQSKVVVCGECSPILWAQGKVEAAIEAEHLWDEIARKYDVDILCGYLGDFRSEENDPVFERLCAEHSAAYSF